MPELKKIKGDIRDIAGRTKNVSLSEMERILKQLPEHGFTVTIRPAGSHAKIIHVDDQIFSVCTHRRGSRQLKQNYVKDFLNAMIALDLYE